jgi:multicomponent K+:H+ antiporter subunit E/multicomponent Na+:H+ antiporter subunit E
MRRAQALAALLSRFLWAVVVSGLQTAWLIARGSRRPVAGFVRMRFSPMSEAGAALLGSLITLTPGTTTIDVDTERCEMLLHLLDASHAEATVTRIREKFEQPLRVWFGRETH